MGNNASQPSSPHHEAPRRTIVPFTDAVAREDIGEDSDLGFFSFVECTSLPVVFWPCMVNWHLLYSFIHLITYKRSFLTYSGCFTCVSA